MQSVQLSESVADYSVAGLLGSWLAGKAAKGIVGEDALEQAKKEDAKNIAQSVENDAEGQAQLAALAQEKLENGEVASEADALEIANSIQKVRQNLQEKPDEKVSTKTNSSTSGISALKKISNNTYMYETMLSSNMNAYQFGTNTFNPFMNSFANPFMMNTAA